MAWWKVEETGYNIANHQLCRFQGRGARGRHRRKGWRISAAVYKIPIGKLVIVRLREDSYIRS